MLGLAIHTTSPQLGLMLQSVEAESAENRQASNTQAGNTQAGNTQTERRYQVWDLGRAVSSQLHTKLMEFIAPHSWQDLAFVAVAKGPGGFTGTRIGVVAARTLAQQLNIPLFGVSSLAAIAAHSLGEDLTNCAEDIVVTMPAKREAVYGAIFSADENGDLRSVREEAVIPQMEWEEAIADWQKHGRAIKQVKAAAGAGIAESVAGVMALAVTRWQSGSRPEWESVLPFYGQHPVHR